MTRHLTLLLSAAVTIMGFSASAQTPAKSPPKAEDPSGPLPLQVELMAELDTAKLRPESTVFVQAIHEWNGPDCHVRVGAVLAAHVTHVEKQTKESKGSNITLNFDRVDCDGHRSDLKMIVIALVAMPWVDYGKALIESTQNYVAVSSGNEAVGGVTIGQDGSFSYGFGRTGGGVSVSHPTFDAKNEKLKIPDSVQPGQVVGTKKITLGVEKGLGGDTILMAAKGNILLQRASQMVLLPKEALHPGSEGMIAKVKTSSTSDGAEQPMDNLTAATGTTETTVSEVDETSICNASCTLVPEKNVAASSSVASTLAFAKLGYKPRDNVAVSNFFNYDSTLSYLDENSILFTYDPRDLRHRYPSGFGTETMHRVRAVVLDRTNLSVQRVVDWQIQGEGRYLWRLGNDGLLAHIGHSLLLLGPDLMPIRQIAVPGQLAFVSVSSSGDHIAVGTLRELHSREMHQQLVDTFGTDPDEGVDIRIFDRSFKLLFVAHENSATLRPPTLSDAGEIRMEYAGRSHWKIQEIRWDHTEHTIANLISKCPVTLNTPRPDALFVVGCTSSSNSWYRILRTDGHLILSGHATVFDTLQCFSSPNGDFAVRLVVPRPAMSRSAHVLQDVEQQQVGVYRANDGKRLLSAVSRGVSQTQQSFAISPGGNQLAVLSDTAIATYQVP